VIALVPDGDYVRMHTSRGLLQAGAVVVAVNAWTSKLLPGFTDVIVPVREQMLAYTPIEPLFTTGVTADVIAGEYCQQTGDGSILVGGCGSVAPDEDVGIWENQPTTVVQEAIEQVLPRLFPSLSPLHVAQRWAGLLDTTTDHHPIVDRVPDMPDVYFVGGFSGHALWLTFWSLVGNSNTKWGTPICTEALPIGSSNAEKMEQHILLGALGVPLPLVSHPC
jgi:gamma-glutamylputrescine oxidase